MLESLIGILVGIVPALALLFFALKDYEGAFEERTLFRLFLWGIFLGLIAVIFEIFGFFSLDPKQAPIEYCVISVVALAVFQSLLKIMVLNRKKFQDQRETTFYGLSLGLGFGAMHSFGYSFAVLTPLFQLRAYYYGVFIIIITFSNLLIQGATGTILGYASAYRKIFRWIGVAVLIHSGFNFVMLITNLNLIIIELSAVIVLCYGIILFVYITRLLFSKSLPEERRKERRRHIRFSTR